MKRIVLSLFFLCCSNFACALVSLQLEAPQVSMGEQFNLNLRIEGTQINSVPDLTPLQADFRIVGTASNINYSIINGKVRAVSEWTITLTPKHSGNLSIPPLTIGQEKTHPISIEITEQPLIKPQSNNSKTNSPFKPQSNQEEVILMAEANVTQPFINQQVIYTVRLYNSSQLLDANYLPPQVEDALFVPFGDGRRYQEAKNGRLYAVEEQQFALFPQKSGDLKISPPVFKALVYDFDGPKRITVQAPQTVLKVKPIPTPFTQGKWFPAKRVTLSQNFDKSTTTLTEGATLERTVTLQAVAVPAQLIPALNFESSKEYNIYPEKPKLTNTVKDQNLVGKSTVKLTYLFNQAGEISVPPISLPWFNTATGKEEISSLPGFKVVVTPGTKKAEPVKPTITPPIPAKPQTLSSQENPASLTSSERLKSPTSYLAWWIAGGFGLAWLLTLLAWHWQRAKQAKSCEEKKSLPVKQLKMACSQNDAREARDALLRWARIEWPTRNLINLNELEHLIDDPLLKQQIQELSQTIYQPSGNKLQWQGKALWEAFSQYRPSTRKKSKKDSLPNLHRL